MRKKSLILIMFSLLAMLVVLVSCAPKEKILNTELKAELESLPKEDLEALVEEGNNLEEQALAGFGARQNVQTPEIDKLNVKITSKSVNKAVREKELTIEEKQVVYYESGSPHIYNLATQVLLKKQQEEINELGKQLAEKQLIIQQPTGKEDQVCFPRDICPQEYECGVYPVPISVECGKCPSGNSCLNNKCHKLI